MIAAQSISLPGPSAQMGSSLVGCVARAERVFMYRKFISILGALGLATALAYFVGIYLAFQSEWASWEEFFVPRALVLVLVPYISLIAHLYLRTRLGQWLLDRGRIEEAISYCEARLDHGLLRSRREALSHRAALGRAYFARSDYERVEELLANTARVARGDRMVLQIQRWRMEAALRLDNLVRCHQAWEAAQGLVRPRRARAYILACRAELASREQDRDGFEEAIEEALWADPENERVALSRVIGALTFFETFSEWREALAILDDIEERIVREAPAREAELDVFRARIYLQLAEPAPAIECLDRAEEGRSDRRTLYERRRVRQLIEERSAVNELADR